MKKNTLIGLGITIVSLLAFGMKVNAGTISITCEKEDLRKGESTTCNINAAGFTEAITSFTAEVESNYLIVSDIKANETIGMKDNGSTGTMINFANTSMNTATSGVLGAFTLTLSENAQDIGDGTCGSLCLKNVRVNGSFVDNFDETASGICKAPGFIEEVCEGEECDPNTGAFTSYLLLGGGAAVALVAIIMVRKNSKFYNV